MAASSSSEASALALHGSLHRKQTEELGLVDHIKGCNMCGDVLRPDSDPQWSQRWFACGDCHLRLCPSCLHPGHPPHFRCRPPPPPPPPPVDPGIAGSLAPAAPVPVELLGPPPQEGLRAELAPAAVVRGRPAAGSSSAAPRTGLLHPAAAAAVGSGIGPIPAALDPASRRRSAVVVSPEPSAPTTAPAPASGSRRSFRRERTERAIAHDRRAQETSGKKQAVVEFYRSHVSQGKPCSLLQAIQQVWPEYYQQNYDPEDPLRSRSRMQAAASRWGKGRCVLPPGRPKVLRQSELDQIRAELDAGSEKSEDELILERIKLNNPDIGKVSRSTLFRLKNALRAGNGQHSSVPASPGNEAATGDLSDRGADTGAPGTARTTTRSTAAAASSVCAAAAANPLVDRVSVLVAAVNSKIPPAAGPANEAIADAAAAVAAAIDDDKRRGLAAPDAPQHLLHHHHHHHRQPVAVPRHPGRKRSSPDDSEGASPHMHSAKLLGLPGGSGEDRASAHSVAGVRLSLAPPPQPALDASGPGPSLPLLTRPTKSDGEPPPKRHK